MQGSLLDACHECEAATCDWTVFETALGWMAIIWHDDRLMAVTFGHHSPQAARRGLPRVAMVSNPAQRLPAWVKSLRSRLVRMAKGTPQEFSDIKLELSHLTPLGRQITAACRAIAWGSTRSYKQLADQVGRPGAARAVGNVMASNRFPLVVPCHRVVGTAGGLGGFSAPGGVATKRQLLDREAGVLIAT